MGYSLRLPGLTLASPSGKKSLFEPFGVAGLARRFEADSFTGAVGSLTNAGWLDKVTNTVTPNNSGLASGPLVGAVIDNQKTVDFKPSGHDLGDDSLTFSEATVAFMLAFTGTETRRIFELAGRRFSIFSTGYEITSVDTAQTGKTQIFTTTAPRPTPTKLTAVVVRLSNGGATDKITLRTAGVTYEVTGTTTVHTNRRLRIGHGSGGTVGNGTNLANMAIWNRVLTDSEVTNTLIPALQTRFGLA